MNMLEEPTMFPLPSYTVELQAKKEKRIDRQGQRWADNVRVDWKIMNSDLDNGTQLKEMVKCLVTLQPHPARELMKVNFIRLEIDKVKTLFHKIYF